MVFGLTEGAAPKMSSSGKNPLPPRRRSVSRTSPCVPRLVLVREVVPVPATAHVAEGEVAAADTVRIGDHHQLPREAVVGGSQTSPPRRTSRDLHPNLEVVHAAKANFARFRRQPNALNMSLAWRTAWLGAGFDADLRATTGQAGEHHRGIPALEICPDRVGCFVSFPFQYYVDLLRFLCDP